MTNRVVEDLTLQTLASTTDLKSLAQGYILNCKCEGKSEATIHYYEGMLRRFLSFCYSNGYPSDPHDITTNHIRQFLWYVANEPIRWNGSSTSARRPASLSTVRHYYRALHTFFNWLKNEGLIPDNPLSHLKRPKQQRKFIQALKPE